MIRAITVTRWQPEAFPDEFEGSHRLALPADADRRRRLTAVAAAARIAVRFFGRGFHNKNRLVGRLAAQQLEQSNFADDILAIVHAAGLSPACFELELTESGLMENVEHAIEVMGVLKAAGFTLSIDDFGNNKKRRRKHCSGSVATMRKDITSAIPSPPTTLRNDGWGLLEDRHRTASRPGRPSGG